MLNSKDRELWRQRLLQGLPPRKKSEFSRDRFFTEYLGEFYGEDEESPEVKQRIARAALMDRQFVFPEDFNEDELEALELGGGWLQRETELRGRMDRAREVCDLVGYGPRHRAPYDSMKSFLKEAYPSRPVLKNRLIIGMDTGSGTDTAAIIEACWNESEYAYQVNSVERTSDPVGGQPGGDL